MGFLIFHELNIAVHKLIKNEGSCLFHIIYLSNLRKMFIMLFFAMCMHISQVINEDLYVIAKTQIAERNGGFTPSYFSLFVHFPLQLHWTDMVCFCRAPITEIVAITYNLCLK